MPHFNFHTKGSEVVETFPEQISGKTFLITGPSLHSLGAYTAAHLAHARPGAFILLGRSESKVQPVINEIKAISPSTAVHFVQVDLASFPSVRRAAAKVATLNLAIDVLLNNAGIMALDKYTTNENGIEMQLATNHLGPFLLTKLLLPLLATPSRIVNVSSAGHALGTVRFGDVNFNDGKEYDLWEGYGQGKAANVLFTRSLAFKLGDRGISAFSLHPGAIHTTNLGINLVNPDWERVDRMFEKARRRIPQRKSTEEGVSTILVACLDPGLVQENGGYLDDCAVEDSSPFSMHMDNAERLWELSEKLVGEKFIV